MATDAAAEGLNLQTLGCLTNIDLPWNPARLQQRTGRIKRYGQRLDTVRMANLAYQGTVEQQILDRLSERLHEQFDMFGLLPDIIASDWVLDRQRLEQSLRAWLHPEREINIFDDRYARDVAADASRH